MNGGVGGFNNRPRLPSLAPRVYSGPVIMSVEHVACMKSVTKTAVYAPTTMQLQQPKKFNSDKIFRAFHSMSKDLCNGARGCNLTETDV